MAMWWWLVRSVIVRILQDLQLHWEHMLHLSWPTLLIFSLSLFLSLLVCLSFSFSLPPTHSFIPRFFMSGQTTEANAVRPNTGHLGTNIDSRYYDDRFQLIVLPFHSGRCQKKKKMRCEPLHSYREFLQHQQITVCYCSIGKGIDSVSVFVSNTWPGLQ